jgi:hypothetical protein
LIGKTVRQLQPKTSTLVSTPPRISPNAEAKAKAKARIAP